MVFFQNVVCSVSIRHLFNPQLVQSHVICQIFYTLFVSYRKIYKNGGISFPSQPGGMGEHHKLPQWGLGQIEPRPKLNLVKSANEDTR